MRISELIRQLQATQQEFGDINVWRYGVDPDTGQDVLIPLSDDSFETITDDEVPDGEATALVGW